MPARLQVECIAAATPEVVHSFRNFGEDLVRVLEDAEKLPLEQVDHAINSFTIGGISTRDIGTVTRRVQALLRKHGLADRVTVRRL
jgi:hypothetical protein